MTDLAPILKSSASAEGLTCRRPPSKPKTCSTCCAPTVLLPAGAAWNALSAALIDAFLQSAEVSPSHPAAAVMKGLNTAAILRDLAGEQCWMEAAYTRTTVLEGDGFTAMLLCWPAGCCSPVHAHSDRESGTKSNCFMAVLQGELTETVYTPEDIDGETVTSAGTRSTMPAGAYTYINDDRGVHKVGNESVSVPAVSLHIYAPGWKAVQIYDEAPTDAGGALIDADIWGDF